MKIQMQNKDISNANLNSLDREFEGLLTDGPTAFNEEEFARCWAAMGAHRDQMLIHLARKCRFHYRRQLYERVASRENALAPATKTLDLEALKRIIEVACYFAFRYLGKRQIVLFMDALALAFEADVESDDFVWTAGECAASAPNCTPGRLEAAVIGVSGRHRYDIERLAGLDAMDLQSQATQESSAA